MTEGEWVLGQVRDRVREALEQRLGQRQVGRITVGTRPHSIHDVRVYALVECPLGMLNHLQAGPYPRVWLHERRDASKVAMDLLGGDGKQL